MFGLSNEDKRDRRYDMGMHTPETDSTNALTVDKVTVRDLRTMVNDPRIDEFLDVEVNASVLPIASFPELSVPGTIGQVAVVKDARTGTITFTFQILCSDIGEAAGL